MYVVYTGDKSTQGANLHQVVPSSTAYPASIIIIYCIGPKRLTNPAMVRMSLKSPCIRIVTRISTGREWFDASKTAPSKTYH